MNKIKGFTLVELLMTVLIIGVLTSVALPQYIKITERARATEAMNMVKSINDAVYAYAASRSDAACPTTFRQLALSVPVEDDNYDVVSLKNFKYELGMATGTTVPGTNCPGATGTRINGGEKYDYVIWHPYRIRSAEGKRATLGCYSPTSQSKSVDLCQSLGLYVEGATPQNGQ